MDRRHAMIVFAAIGALIVGNVPLLAKPADELRPEVPINALVIGVSYARAPEIFHLANTLKDAHAIADFLRGRLRQSVMLVEDPDLDQLTSKVDSYINGLNGKELALIYYAGHGAQVGGQNYIVSGEAQALVPLGEIVERARRKAKLVVLILDACRNNPFATDDKATSGRSVRIARIAEGASRGLASVPVSAAQLGALNGLTQFSLQGRGVKVVFATDPGNVALDSGTSGGNSPFTSALVRALVERKSLDEVLADVTRDVAKETAGQQTPWVQGSLEESVYMAGKPKRFDRGGITMPMP